MKPNTEVIPGSPLYSDKGNDKEVQYKADLKVISAMCLQGLLANRNRAVYPVINDVNISIQAAKELLKQLEAENEK